MLIDKETKDALVKENIPTIMGGGCPEWTSLKKKNTLKDINKKLSKMLEDEQMKRFELIESFQEKVKKVLEEIEQECEKIIKKHFGSLVE